MKKIIIATRGSALALWQANHIKDLLCRQYEDLEVELNIIKTKGDIILDVPLAKVGGKGLFVKEIEDALLNGSADLAVHSMKDVPMELPQGLVLGAVPEREDRYDVFLSKNYASVEELPQNAVLGTSSLRRQAQILALRPDLSVKMLRGNVQTRINKMLSGEYDAIILAAAGIKRLNLSVPHQIPLTAPKFLPACGQGALGIEVNEKRSDILEMIAFLNHAETKICVEAERAFLKNLDGGCQVPIAAHSQLKGKTLVLEGLVAEPDASKIIRYSLEDEIGNHIALGENLAQLVLNNGGKEILERLYNQ